MLVTANILQPLIDVNEAVLHFFHDKVGFGWGLSIICLTIAIRLLILPLTFKQVRSMQEMQRFSPEIQKLRERYKDDKQRQNEELMKLYKEHGFNPLGSCLPLVLQLPFFFSLYQTLKSGGGISKEIAASGHTGFLFIPDLTKPLTHDTPALIAMIVLYVGSQLGSSYVSSLNVQDKNQRRLLFISPFVFVRVVINFPAGLLVYWVTTNFFTIGQQLAVRRFFPSPALQTAGAGKSGPGVSSEPPEPRASRKRGPKAATGNGGGDGKAAGVSAGKADGAKPAKTPKAGAGANGSKGNGKGAQA